MNCHHQLYKYVVLYLCISHTNMPGQKYPSHTDSVAWIRSHGFELGRKSQESVTVSLKKGPRIGVYVFCLIDIWYHIWSVSMSRLAITCRAAPFGSGLDTSLRVPIPNHQSSIPLLGFTAGSLPSQGPRSVANTMYNH